MGQRGELPVGTVTFVFTDVVGSTALWEQAPEAMAPAMSCHDELVEAAVTDAGGMLVRPRGEGDSRFAVFSRASEALNGAVAIQKGLESAEWATPKPIVVRIAVHTGEADLRDGDYYGSAVNRCARLRSLAHPGQILVSQATADLAAGTMTLRDLGSHRLKDLTAPERVHQVVHPDIPSDFPPVVSIDVIPNNLPVQVTELVGRSTELDDLAERLESERMVTLTGPGGTGKSRLALAVAAEVIDRFPDGVRFVELASITDPELVAPTVAAVVGNIDDSGDVVDALMRTLAEKRVLVVLDNCEHVIDGAAKLVDTLLRSVTDVRFLAASQEPLNLNGEGVFPVAPLNPDDALTLFGERARSANPAFALDGATLDAARAICERLDGIPLALELAATRTRGMSAAQIAERLDDRFKLLTGGSRSAPERHRTLAAALEWTHDLLSEPEQLLYRRLGVFTGGATLEAIEAVCTAVDGIDPFDLYDLLQNLVDRSLVALNLTHEPPRYRMLETVLAHARTKLEPAEHRELRDHHLEHFARQAVASKAGIRDGIETAAWLSRLRADHDNLRAAFAWSLDGGDPSVGLRAAGYLGVFWNSIGTNLEALRWLTALLDATADEPTSDHAVALESLAWTLHYLGRGEDAVAAATRASEMARHVGDKRVEADVSFSVGGIRNNVSGGRDGTSDVRRAVELFDELGDERYAMFTRQQLGDMLVDQCRPAEAVTYLEEADRWARKEGHVRVMAASAVYGIALLDLGEVDRAVEIATGRTALVRDAGDELSAMHAGINEAEVLAAAGSQAVAAHLLADSARTCFESELTGSRPFVLVAAASFLKSIDPATAIWVAAAAVGEVEAEGGRLPPRGERSIFAVETTARAALGDGYDAMWRAGTTASTDEVNERVLATLDAIAEGNQGE